MLKTPGHSSWEQAIEVAEQAGVSDEMDESITVQEVDVNSYLELIRSDAHARRTQYIAAYMNSRPEDSPRFWPIFREYEFESMQLMDGKIALINSYIEYYGDLTDERAVELAEKFFSL